MTRTPEHASQPTDTFEGAPVYRAGHAPEQLLTVRQLTAQRRRILPDQRPAAWLDLPMPYRGSDYVPLYRLADSIRRRPLGPRAQRAYAERRTCAHCAAEFPDVLHGGHIPSLRTWARWCATCIDADRDRSARTCARCATEFTQSASVRNGNHGSHCVPCADHAARAWAVVRALVERACPRCTAETATAEQVAAARAADHGWWVPITCAPCQAEEQAEREEAQRRAYRRRWPDVEPVRAWARALRADPDGFAVLDTETTGLGSGARIVEIAVYSGTGEKLLDTLVCPGPGIEIPEEATAIHGITTADVADFPTLGELLPKLTRVLAGRRLVIYNQSFDAARLVHELDLWHRATTPLLLPLDPWETHPSASAWMDAQLWDECAMEQYAIFFGEWNDYFGSYTWQKLGGGHRAGGDCLAVLDRLAEIANAPDPE